MKKLVLPVVMVILFVGFGCNTEGENESIYVLSDKNTRDRQHGTLNNSPLQRDLRRLGGRNANARLN